MKRILTAILAAAALWGAQPAMANDPDDYMYVPDVQLNKDGQGTVYVYYKTNIVEYNTVIMNLYLPEGFTIQKNSRGNYIFNWNKEEDVAPSHTMQCADHDGYIRMLGVSASNEYLLPGEHWLFNFTVQAPEGFKSSAEASFRNIEFAEGTVRTHYFDDAYFTITPYDESTGIENVSVDFTGEDVIYDLTGRRVEHPTAPGIYIVNGEKKIIR